MEKSAIFRIVQKKRQILFEILNATMERILNNENSHSEKKITMAVLHTHLYSQW